MSILSIWGIVIAARYICIMVFAFAQSTLKQCLFICHIFYTGNWNVIIKWIDRRKSMILLEMEFWRDLGHKLLCMANENIFVCTLYLLKLKIIWSFQLVSIWIRIECMKADRVWFTSKYKPPSTTNLNKIWFTS